MVLAWPLALLGLAALALPLLVHFLHRGRSRRVYVASTRFIGAAHTPRWRRLRLQQPGLLALRCLLLVAATLLLAQPFVERARTGGGNASWVLVSPRVGVDAAREVLGARWDSASERRWLAPGFAPLTSSPPDARAQASSLTAEADAVAPPSATLHVVVAGDAAGLAARRPVFSERVRVTSVPSVVPAGTDGDAPPVATLVVDDPTAAPRLREVLRAWHAAGALARFDEVAPAAATHLSGWIVWHSSAPVPPRPPAATRTLVVPWTVDEARGESVPATAAAGAPTAQWLGERRAPGERWLIAGPEFFEGRVALADAAQTLLDAMHGDAAAWPTPAYPVATGEWSAAQHAKPSLARTPLSGVLAWVLALLFAAERIVSARVIAGQARG